MRETLSAPRRAGLQRLQVGGQRRRQADFLLRALDVGRGAGSVPRSAAGTCRRVGRHRSGRRISREGRPVRPRRLPARLPWRGGAWSGSDVSSSIPLSGSVRATQSDQACSAPAQSEAFPGSARALRSRGRCGTGPARRRRRRGRPDGQPSRRGAMVRLFGQIGRQVVAIARRPGPPARRHRCRHALPASPDWRRTAPSPHRTSPNASAFPAPARPGRADRAQEGDPPAIAARRHRRWRRAQVGILIHHRNEIDRRHVLFALSRIIPAKLSFSR